MTTVFIAGSMNIKNLDPRIKERIDKIVDSGFEVVVGDADGADASIQKYLSSIMHSNTTVFCSGGKPRNNLGAWPVREVDTQYAPGTRAFYTAKDVEMAKIADYGLMIWDTKSTGTLSNVIELLARKKKSLVFVNKAKQFKSVGEVAQLEELLECMSESARLKADQKIHLSEKIMSLKNMQADMFS